MSTADTPVIIALDACTEACSVALTTGGNVFSRHAVIPRGHARELLPMLDGLLAEAGVSRDAIGLVAYGRGPGAFTGVRISVAVAQGLARGLGCPVIGVSSLQAVADVAGRDAGPHRVAVAIDARMGEVYWGLYERLEANQPLKLRDEEAVLPPAAVTLPTGWTEWQAAGTGWAVHSQALLAALGTAPARILDQALPDARCLLPHAVAAWRNGTLENAASARPVYLRDNVTG
ncbi:tRNA (adenosine(37)-N6)-threonylcarbamoyltransferase complex dimerization subunit type 1 TsaB [Methylonatrum kenyense]|uniref:tRNA (adenosine(37)-N6)-threonylcarbamoyltransferase complex dimerization subunit type 1 TsaB n=1 Tax=Methylonatrum kenyense TaxID=455253 RepID=UPI0020BD923F|nr:tRNA (adenosine(37)-N6)-threonylcarbamoyltransferase complex dimerization subunit type 1 TsaB [Methylonatrum kenyense]MCK8514888.1 tRNA (adenosine(37)-N6)-threonylcarbamoyltransferase complex dimerization subunit type 1 TsaB [Methylonatrum kenyense]